MTDTEMSPVLKKPPTLSERLLMALEFCHPPSGGDLEEAAETIDALRKENEELWHHLGSLTRWPNWIGYDGPEFYELIKKARNFKSPNEPIAPEFRHDQPEELATKNEALKAREAELVEALNWLINNPKMQCSLSGNPNYIDTGLAKIHALIAKGDG